MSRSEFEGAGVVMINYSSATEQHWRDLYQITERSTLPSDLVFAVKFFYHSVMCLGIDSFEFEGAGFEWWPFSVLLLRSIDDIYTKLLRKQPCLQIHKHVQDITKLIFMLCSTPCCYRRALNLIFHDDCEKSLGCSAVHNLPAMFGWKSQLQSWFSVMGSVLLLTSIEEIYQLS